MTDLSALLGPGLKLFGAINDHKSLARSEDLNSSAILYEGQALRDAAARLPAELSFNLAVDNMNLNRRLSALSRQAQRTFSSQTAALVASGVSLDSKSALMLRNEAADQFSRVFLDTKVDAENERKIKVFESKSRAIQLENAARAKDFEAEIRVFKAGQQASSQLMSSALSIGSRVSTLLSR